MIAVKFEEKEKIGLQYALETLHGCSPFGQERIRRLRFYAPEERAALEQRLREREKPDFPPARQAELAKELVRRFLDTATANRELLVSLIERVELTQEKNIIIKFRFRQLQGYFQE